MARANEKSRTIIFIDTKLTRIYQLVDDQIWYQDLLFLSFAEPHIGTSIQENFTRSVVFAKHCYQGCSRFRLLEEAYKSTKDLEAISKHPSYRRTHDFRSVICYRTSCYCNYKNLRPGLFECMGPSVVEGNVR